MINNVIDAICKALNDEFGNEYTIYIRQKLQSPVTPCFLVSGVSLEQKRYQGKRRYCQYTFEIQYLPSTQAPISEINAVLQRMFECLEYINEGENILSATGNKAEITDEVLHFTVNYNFFTMSDDTADSMEQAVSKTIMKG